MRPSDLEPGDRVTRGIAQLAPAAPAWWAAGPQGIDLTAIDFLDLDRGTLAQVFGSHEEGLRVLHIPGDLAPEFGFAALGDADNILLKRVVRLIVDSFRAEAAMPSPPR